MNKKGIIIGGIIILLIILVVVFNNNSYQKESGPLKVGFIGSLTGVDPDYGESMKNGLQLAIEEINNNGGVDGRKIEVIYEDGKCIEGAKAVSAAQKLINVDKVKVIIDGSCSTGLLAYAPMAEENNVVVISSGATADSVTDAGDYIFRNVPSSSIAGNLLAEVVISNEHEKIAIISENSDYAKTLQDAFLSKFNNLNGNVVANEIFQTGTKDFRTNLLKIRNSDPDAIIVNPQSADLVTQIIKQAREIGIGSQVYIAYFTLPSVVEAGSFVDGTLAVDLPSSIQQDYIGKYVNKYGMEPPYKFSSVLAYDSGYLIADALKEVGLDSKKIKDYLYGFENFEGVSGTYHFDENGDVIGVPHSLKIIQNGNISTIVEEL